MEILKLQGSAELNWSLSNKVSRNVNKVEGALLNIMKIQYLISLLLNLTYKNMIDSLSILSVFYYLGKILKSLTEVNEELKLDDQQKAGWV